MPGKDITSHTNVDTGGKKSKFLKGVKNKMATNISLNQFAPNTPIAGLYVYMANLGQLHNVIVSSTQTTPLAAGAILTLDSTSANSNAPVAKQAAVTDAIFGVLVYNPIVNRFNAGDKIAVARDNDIIWMPAAAAITAGAELYFNTDNEVTSVATAGNSVIGKALTPAKAKGDFVQVELGFRKTTAGGS